MAAPTTARRSRRSTAGDRPPSGWERHLRSVTAVLAALLGVGFVYYVLPHLVDLGPTLRRLREVRVAWLVLGVALEACSLFGEVALFLGVFARPGNRIGWRSSAEITLAGAAATKVVAAAGAGGVAEPCGGFAPMACPAPQGQVLARHARGARVSDDFLLASDGPGGDRICPSAARGRGTQFRGAVTHGPALRLTPSRKARGTRWGATVRPRLSLPAATIRPNRNM